MHTSQPPFQFRLRTLFILMAVVAVLLGAYAWWHRTMSNFLVGYTGPVPLRDEWPDRLKSLLDEASDLPCDESTIKVHCLCQGFDPEYVWRMDAAPGVFDEMKRRWRLTETTDPKLYKLEGYKSSISGAPTPKWWSPRNDGTTSFWVSPQVLARGKSDRFHVALDTKRNTIFVYYWFNF